MNKYIEASNKIDWLNDEDAQRSFIIDRRLAETTRSRIKPLEKPLTVVYTTNHQHVIKQPQNQPQDHGEGKK
jgi:hypothetical protein